MARNIITALDVGTSTVQAAVAERTRGTERLRVLGIGIAPSAGIRRGVVVDLDDATASIRSAVQEAQRASGVEIKSAYVAVGGSHISVASSKGIVAVSRADGEISHEDVKRVIAAAETFVARNPNKTILHMIPRDFKVDDEAGIKDPVSMHGNRLEVDTLIIECSSPFLKNLLKCVETAGLSVDDYVFAPLAASCAVLTKRSRELGVMLVDIGGGVASFIVFEESVPIHAGVIPIGGNLITHDVAIGFKTPVDIAERIKMTYGSCLPDEMPKRETIRLAEFVPEDATVYSRKELAQIVEARVRDIFELLQKELKKIERKHLLPAGLVLVGGSAVLPGLVKFTKQEIGLPVEMGAPAVEDAPNPELAPALATTMGVLHWADMRLTEPASAWATSVSHLGSSKLMRWLKSLLP